MVTWAADRAIVTVGLAGSIVQPCRTIIGQILIRVEWNQQVDIPLAVRLSISSIKVKVETFVKVIHQWGLSSYVSPQIWGTLCTKEYKGFYFLFYILKVLHATCKHKMSDIIYNYLLTLKLFNKPFIWMSSLRRLM